MSHVNHEPLKKMRHTVIREEAMDTSQDTGNVFMG